MGLLVGIVIGLVLGLTGAGGSVFAVPLLILLLGLPVQQAIGISLGAVFVSALFGVFTHLKSKQILWLPAIVFSVLGGAFAPVGGWIGRQISEPVLMIGFGVLVVLIATRMWTQAVKNPEDSSIVRASKPNSDDPATAICRINNNQRFKLGLPCILGVSGGAIVTGILSGLFGVGGGFMIIPTLIYLTGIGMKQAVATSLVVISVISATGFSSFLMAGNEISTSVLMWVAIGGILGMLVSIGAGKKIAGPSLQKAFSILMLLMAGIILAKQFL
tara:strand:- start:2078 stop:2896 length:819 start_codon:yes stop_codon:yes gene_type:complete